MNNPPLAKVPVWLLLTLNSVIRCEPIAGMIGRCAFRCYKVHLIPVPLQ